MTITNMKFFAPVLVVLMCVACSRNYEPPAESNNTPTASTHTRTPSRQERVLVQQGYTNIQMTGVPMWGCSEDDSMIASSNFTATAPSGDNVDGTVCCGLVFKGCTVRFD